MLARELPAAVDAAACRRPATDALIPGFWRYAATHPTTRPRSARRAGAGRSASSATASTARATGCGSRRRAGRAAGDRRRQQRRVPRRRAGGGPDRDPLHARQPPPRRPRDRLHPRRLRRPPRRHRRRAGARRRRARRRRRAVARLDPVDGLGRRSTRTSSPTQPAGPPADRARRLDHALHVGHVGPAQGRAQHGAAGRRPEEAAEPRDVRRSRRFGIDLADHVGDGVHLVTSPLYHAAPISQRHSSRCTRAHRSS